MYLLPICLSATSQTQNLFFEMFGPLWFGPCGKGSGKNKKLAILLSGEMFYKKQECQSPNIVRIVKGCQKETFLLLALLSIVNTREASLLDEPL